MLKYSEYLSKQGKFIEKESRERYLKFLKKFLSNRITSARFCEILPEKLELNDELANKLQRDIIHEKAANFIDFFDNLSIFCEVCNRNPESCRLSGHINESELRNEIEKVYKERSFLTNNPDSNRPNNLPVNFSFSLKYLRDSLR